MKVVLVALCLLNSFAAPAWSNSVGQEIPDFSLEDQYGNAHRFNPEIWRIYANNSRAGDKIMEAAMKDLSQSELDAQRALVVADISKAPGFVKRIIRSGLKDRNYTTLLDKKGSSKKFLRFVPDRVTVIELKNGQISAIRNTADAETLRQELLQQRPATDPAPTTQPAPAANN